MDDKCSSTYGIPYKKAYIPIIMDIDGIPMNSQPLTLLFFLFLFSSLLFSSQDECEKFYKMGKTLGQGSFATVKLATSKRDGGKFAIKVIKRTSLGPEDETALRSEVKVLQTVDHPNIVKLTEVFDCANHFYMVMEVCAGGELFDRIVEKEHYDEDEAKKAIRQIASALDYCHERKIVHRDLKPENLLYGDATSDATSEGTLKLADFGLAKLLDSNTMLHTACGTPGYVAPEILMSNPYDVQVDMWSLGIISYILLCGFPPFYDDNNSALFRSIKSGKFDYPSPFWDDVSSDARDLIDKLLVLDPNKRFTAKEVLSHHWVSDTKASNRRLSHFTACMKSYNARRKFRAGIMSLQAISAMKGLVQLNKGPAPGAAGAKLMGALGKKQAIAEETEGPVEVVGEAVSTGSAAEDKSDGAVPAADSALAQDTTATPAE